MWFWFASFSSFYSKNHCFIQKLQHKEAHLLAYCACIVELPNLHAPILPSWVVLSSSNTVISETKCHQRCNYHQSSPIGVWKPTSKELSTSLRARFSCVVYLNGSPLQRLRLESKICTNITPSLNLIPTFYGENFQLCANVERISRWSPIYPPPRFCSYHFNMLA